MAASANLFVDELPVKFKYCPGIFIEWTRDEEALLHDLLVKYASESHYDRCTIITTHLRNKTARDIALRSRHMIIQMKNSEQTMTNEGKTDAVNGKRSKGTRTIARKGKMVKIADSSTESSGAGITKLLKQNAQILAQISANIGALKINDNIGLLCQARNNILSILKDLNEAPDMKQHKNMPPLFVKLNEELARSILPL